MAEEKLLGKIDFAEYGTYPDRPFLFGLQLGFSFNGCVVMDGGRWVIPVRCKDCKHRPTKPEKHIDGFDLEFPDDVCPCKCEDPFYSWYPSDDWFCPRGKRKGGDE